MSAPHEMHENSIATYREEAATGRLSKREFEVIEILERIGQGTDREILAASEFSDMNDIRPRVSELVKRGVLEQFDNIQDKTTGKKVRVVRIANRALRNPIPGRRALTWFAVDGNEAVTRTNESQPISGGAPAAESAPVEGFATELATCTRCKGTGRLRVSTEPVQWAFCDEARGKPCSFAERRRRVSGDPNQELSSPELEALAR